jgi:predicted O-methyltransferase YrrM
MGRGRSILEQLNRVLRAFNLRLDTLTREKEEVARLHRLRALGHFTRPVFPLAPGFDAVDEAPLLDALNRFRSRLEDLVDPSRNEVGFSLDNDYFGSPDAEVLYALVRDRGPRTVVEVGSGYSTMLTRQAILDSGHTGRIVSIDPEPRRDVRALVDEFHRTPVESLTCMELFDTLDVGDMLFIDSSHTLRTGGDVAFLYLQVLPRIRPGVLVHIHDVFLPWDYPEEWVVGARWGWNEQYLVQALLQSTHLFEVVWAGHHFQRTNPRFDVHFPLARGRSAKSLWLRRRAD